jgi:hypothetical protein
MRFALGMILALGVSVPTLGQVPTGLEPIVTSEVVEPDVPVEARSMPAESPLPMVDERIPVIFTEGKPHITTEKDGVVMSPAPEPIIIKESDADVVDE